MGKFPFFGTGDDDDEGGLMPDELEAVIKRMYLPAGSVEYSDDLLSHTEIVENIRTTLPQVKAGHVFTKLVEMGFLSKTIEGTIYWLVVYD